MKQIRGFKVIKTLEKSEYSQIILLEKYGVNYILKMSPHPDYNHLISREFYLLKYLYSTGFVPRPLAIGNISKRKYFIREWLEGEPLGDFLKDKNDDTKFDYMKETFCILFRLQSHGIAIIDISPSNFIVDKKGKLFVLDLGFAYLGEKKPELLGGTLPYAAPEILNPNIRPPYPYKADVYSTGAMFYEIFTGIPPYEAPNPDALFLSQHSAPPLFTNIKHKMAKIILQKALEYEPSRRPTISSIIGMFDYLPLKYCLIPRTFQLIFSSLNDTINENLSTSDELILNIFSSSFPLTLREYVRDHLKMLLETKSFKVSIDNPTNESDITVFVDNLPDTDSLKNLKYKKRKVIIFSNTPVEIPFDIKYVNFAFDEFNEEKAEEVLNRELLGGNILEDDVPLYVKINLKILEGFGKKSQIEYPATLKSVADYIHAEFPYIIDFLKRFIFAVPRGNILVELLKDKKNIKYTSNVMEQYASLIDTMEALGFVENTSTHIILTPLFDKYFRKDGRMKTAEVIEKDKTSNIYDILEGLLVESRENTSDLLEKILKVIKRKDIPRSHIAIFLNKLIENIEREELRIKLLRVAISMGFWRTTFLVWEKLMEKYRKSREFNLAFAKIAAGVGKYREAVMMLNSLNTPKARSLLLYTYALYGKYEEIKKLLEESSEIEKDAYYYIAMGFFHLFQNHNTKKAKNFAIKAGEISHNDSHIKTMSQYLYAIALREEGNIEKALRVLEEIYPVWDIVAEALLVNFQLGYLYYKKGLVQKAQYYFEYAFLLATEIKHLSFSVQAAFYLGYIYKKNNRLSSSYNYFNYTYKYLRFLHESLKPVFFRDYFDTLISFEYYDRARELLKNYKEATQYINPVSMALLYYKDKNVKGLEEVAEKIKHNKDMLDMLNKMIDSIKGEKTKQ